MLLSLQNAFHNLLKEALPDLFDGEAAPVAVTFPSHEWDFDPSSADPTAGEPAQDDARDLLPFHPEAPQGPYSLERPPYSGPKRVYLRGPQGDRSLLGPAEVQWNPLDSGAFTLSPKPSRLLSPFTQVEVLYGVTAVFTKLKTLHRLPVHFLAQDAEQAEEGEALALAVFALNRPALMKDGAFTHAGGGYGIQGEIKGLKLRKGDASAPGERRLFLEAEAEMKVSRALREDEGRPIERILSPGAVPDPDRPVDVRIDVEA